MTVHSQNAIDSVLIDITAMTDGSTHTANFDCASADYATIRVFCSVLRGGAAGAGPTVNLLESDDTTASNFATIVAAQTDVASTATGVELRYEVDMRARKRYLQISVVPDTADTNDDFTGVVLGTLTRNDAEPVSTTAMGDDIVVNV